MSQLINHSTGEVITGVNVTKTSLTLPEGISFDEWLEVGKQLDEIETGIGWWRGDWWIAKNPVWGEREKEAEAAGVSWSTAKNCAAVSGQIQTARRRANLPFSHHSC